MFKASSYFFTTLKCEDNNNHAKKINRDDKIHFSKSS
jgi:hypothetical protein